MPVSETESATPNIIARLGTWAYVDRPRVVVQVVVERMQKKNGGFV